MMTESYLIDAIITEAGFILIGGLVALIPVYLLGLVLGNVADGTVGNGEK